MMSDYDDRAWWVFDVPLGAVAYVPANTEDDARRLLARHSYPNAPVHAWPCVGSRWTSRAALVAETARRSTAT